LSYDWFVGDLPAVIIIEAPKNRRYMGERQFVLVKDPANEEWLLWFVPPLAGS
jgi:hypothetical protein